MLVLMAHGGDFRVAAAAGEAGRELVGTVVPRDGTIAGNVAASGEPERVAHLQERGGHGLEAVAERPGASAGRAARISRARARRPRGARHPAGPGLRCGSGAPPHLVRRERGDRHRGGGVRRGRAPAAARCGRRSPSGGAGRASCTTRHSRSSARSTSCFSRPRRAAEPGALESAVQKALEQTRAQHRLTPEPDHGAAAGVAGRARCPARARGAREADVRLLRRCRRDRPRLRVRQAVARPRVSPDDIESTLYRLVQEAITNAVKHAEADTISVGVAEADETIVVTVRDDGSGFDPEARTARIRTRRNARAGRDLVERPAADRVGPGTRHARAGRAAGAPPRARGRPSASLCQ